MKRYTWQQDVSSPIHEEVTMIEYPQGDYVKYGDAVRLEKGTDEP